MIKYSEIITEDSPSLFIEERKQTRAKLRDRIRMLRLLKTGEARSLCAVTTMIGLGITQVRKLFNCYRKEGISGLLLWRYKGNHRKLKAEEEEKIIAESYARENGFVSQKEAQLYILATFGVNMTQPGVSVLFSRNGIRNKTGRPLNILTSKADQEVYKKNSHPN